MNQPYTDTWQMYYAPQVAARNRWAVPPADVPSRESTGRRRSLPRRLAPLRSLAPAWVAGWSR